MMADVFVLEIRLLLRSRVFIGFSAVLILLSAFAGWVGGEFVRGRSTSIVSAAALEAATDSAALATADRIRAGEIDPPWYQSPLHAQAWSYAMIRHVHLPPRPWGGAAVGDADLRPFLFRINPHPPERWSNRAAEGTPSIAALGGFDLVDLILVLTPLVVLVAMTDVIRDRGGSERQRLAVVQGGSVLRVLAVRFAPRATLILVLVAIAGAAGLASILPPPSASIGAGALILGGLIAHAACWILVAAVLLGLLRRSTSIFSAFAALWFVFGIMAPVLVEASARTLTPPPSALSVFAEERAALVDARNRKEDLVRAYASTDTIAGRSLLDALAQNQQLITPTNLLIQREVDRTRAAARREEREVRSAFEERVATLSAISPTLVARRWIHSITGRGLARRAAFDEQVDGYHDYLQESFVGYLLRRTSPDSVILPRPFSFREPAS